MKLRLLPFLFFFGFIIWVIWQANINGTNYIFDWVDEIPYKDKIGHFTLYGILAVFFDFALDRSNWSLRKIKVSKGAILVLLFAVLEEITQLWIPARNFDLMDAAADLCGILIMVYTARWLVKTGKLKKWIEGSRATRMLTF